jgi:hypothetical protein
MSKTDNSDNIDWSLTTWEGARREQLRRWAKLPLEQIIAALEEMQELSEAFSETQDESTVGIKSEVAEHSPAYQPAHQSKPK